MNTLQTWWQSLVQRERIVVSILAVVIVMVLFQMMIWQPVHQARLNAYISIDKQSELLQWMKQQAEIARTLQPNSNVSKLASGSIGQRVNLAAKKHKITISRLQTSDQNTIQIWLVDADFSQVLLYLQTLQTKYNVLVTSIAVTETNKPGLVDVRVSFSSH